jgi:serine/threonine-protein kinase
MPECGDIDVVMHQQPTIVPDGLAGRTFGNYVARHKLGEGGMGSVYFAEHPSIGKRVALKVLHAEFASQPEIVSRFFNEAKAVNDIQHPNIVDIVDFGTIPPAIATDPPTVYFIMEYIEGASLTDLIRREGPLHHDRAAAIALQIADALSASHAKGIVHRDLKPDNVMLVTRGRERDFVKLLDFGIAKLTGSAASSHRTRTGMVIGTPQYMSPEQCEGRGNIDQRTDVYSLGVVLYQMLTGRPPFAGDGFGEVLVQQMTTPPLAPSAVVPQVPEFIELVVLKALEKRPDDRYPRMDDMMLALQDPAQYIQAHGGRAGFLASPVLRDPALVGSRAVIAMLHAAPGHAAPTTLSGSASQVRGARPTRSRKRLAAALALGAGVAALGAAVALGGITRDSSSVVRDEQTTQQLQAPVGSISSALATAPVPSAPPAPPALPPRAASSPPVAMAQAPGEQPAAEPAPPVAPEAAISITIESRPQGAQVFLDGEPTARGATPYVLDLSSTTATELRLLRTGYKPMTTTISPRGDRKLVFTLERATAGSQRPAGSPAPSVKPDAGPAAAEDSDDTMDPFKKKGAR